MKRIKRGLPVDAPFPATRTVSFAPAPPSVSPTDNRSPFSSQNEPIRFDPFAKDPAYSTPPQAQVNDRRPFTIDFQASQQPGPRPFVSGIQGLPQLPSPLPPASTFAPINRNNSAFATVNPPPVNPPPRLDTSNRSASTPINPSHYDATNGPKFQAREHYSPMNPPPFPNRTPIGPSPAPGSGPAPGITMTKRGPSTHPYMFSEAFAKRHGNCDRKDSQGRGIWRHEATNTDRYIRCNHDNCGRMDWKTLHGFACHIVRRHDVPKGTLQGIQDALDRYGYEVGQAGNQSGPSSSHHITPNAPITPITPPVPGQTTKKQQSPDEDDESPDGPAYRMQGTTPEPYHEELVYSDDSESEGSPKEEAPDRLEVGDALRAGDLNKEPAIPKPAPADTPTDVNTTQNTGPPMSSSITYTESSARSIPADPLKPAQFASLPSSEVTADLRKPPASSSTAPPAVPSSIGSAVRPPLMGAFQNVATLAGTPAPSLDTKLAEEVKKANEIRSQQDSDYVQSQTMTPQSPTLATTPTAARRSGSRPSTAQGHRGSRMVDVQTIAPIEPAAASKISTTTPPRSPQQHHTVKTAVQSPYRQRVSLEGFAEDAAKRMDKRDLEDSDYTESQNANETQPETQTQTQTQTVAETQYEAENERQTETSTTWNPTSTAPQTSTLNSDQPLRKPSSIATAANASSSKKRPTTRDGLDSPLRSPASINKANGFPSKARRIGSRHNSVGKAPTPITVPSATAPASSSALSSPAIAPTPAAVTAAATATTADPETVQQGTSNSDTDETDSIIVTAVRPAPATTVTTTTAQDDHHSSSGGGGRTRRTAAAAAASRGWSTLVSRRVGGAGVGEPPIKTEREGVLKLEDIPSSPHREKVRRILKVFSRGDGGTTVGGSGEGVVSVKKAVEALAECGGREEDAINALLDADSGIGRGEREKERGLRRRGLK